MSYPSNLFNLIKNSAFKYPENEAIYCKNRRIRYRELLSIINLWSRLLSANGIHRGDKIGIMLPNCDEFIYSYFAIAKIGAIAVLINPQLKEREIQYVYRNSSVVSIIKMKENMEVVLVNLETNEQKLLPSYEDVIDGGEKLSVSKHDRGISNYSDHSTIFYTSGTTGYPKGVLHTHKNMIYNPLTVAKTWNVKSSDIFLLVTPLCHLYACGPGMIAALGNGAKIVLTQNYDILSLPKLISIEKVTVLLGVPSLYVSILSLVKDRHFENNFLRLAVTSGAICSQDIIKDIRRHLCKDVINTYGMTEVGIAIQTPLNGNRKFADGTVGKPLLFVKVKIVDENNREIQDSRPGEIVCKSPTRYVSYYNPDRETSKALDNNGWYHTGDLGSRNEKGIFRILGRKDDLIIRKGINVYPSDVELVLNSISGVKEAAVIGLENRKFGQEIVAYIVTKNKKLQPREDEFRISCSKYLAEYKLPDKFHFVKSLPKSSTGKILKYKLVDKNRN